MPQSNHLLLSGLSAIAQRPRQVPCHLEGMQAHQQFNTRLWGLPPQHHRMV